MGGDMAIGEHNTASWSEISGSYAPFDGYSHWEAAAAQDAPRATLLFAELRAGGTVATLRDAIGAISNEPLAKLQIAERDALAAELAELDRLGSGASGSPDGNLSLSQAAFPWRVTVAFFWLGQIENVPPYCHLLHVGPRIHSLSETDRAPLRTT